MTSKKRFIRGSRKPSMVGRGTTTVKRQVLGQKKSGNTCNSSQKSSRQSTTRLLNK